QTVPLDHNEALGPTKPANLVVIADHFTEWAGGRPHTDVRLANSFDPRLVKPRLTGAVGRDVENPVTDLGSACRSRSSMTAARISFDVPIFLIDSNRDQQLLFSSASPPGRLAIGKAAPAVAP